jgi:hypothetical protein
MADVSTPMLFAGRELAKTLGSAREAAMERLLSWIPTNCSPPPKPT